MKAWRYLTLWALVAGLMLVLAICFMPASWALAWYGERLPGFSLGQVSGSVWRGQAGQVRDRAGLDLGSLHWQLSPAILLGRLELHFDLGGAGLSASGQLQRRADERLVIDHAQAHATPEALARLLGQPSGPCRGQLYLEVSHAVLWHGWPMTLEAQLGWRDARVEDQGRSVELGNLVMRARSQQGLLTAELDDDGGGPLRVHGQGRLNPLAWKIEADAGSRGDNPSLSAWLAGFGALDAHGMVHVRRQGGVLDYLH